VGALIAGSTALADGATRMAFTAGATEPAEALGSTGWLLFAGACAAFVAIVALLAAAHAALGRCAAALDEAERALPEVGER
jgi:hypothetical protein